jgi:hypothetical protein
MGIFGGYWRRRARKKRGEASVRLHAVENEIVQSLRGQQRRPSSKRAPRAAPSESGVQSVAVTWLPGTYEIPVAGLEHRAAAVLDTVKAIRAGGEIDAVLLPEPSNAHDPNAIAIYTAGGLIGYVQRRIAAVLRPALTALSASNGGMPAGCPARIGVREHDSPQVVLLIDLGELGIGPAALNPQSQP